MQAVDTNTAYIERGSPWENGYIESFNARLRDELLDGEIFYSLREAQTVIESRRRHYNRIRPHAPEVRSRYNFCGLRKGQRRALNQRVQGSSPCTSTKSAYGFI
jgi:hypothetical protein